MPFMLKAVLKCIAQHSRNQICRSGFSRDKNPSGAYNFIAPEAAPTAYDTP